MKIRLLHYAVSRVQSLTFAVDVLDFNTEALRCSRVAHCLFCFRDRSAPFWIVSPQCI